MTPTERLTAYELALTDYEKAIGKNERYLLDNNLACGLCFYFKHAQNIAIYFAMKQLLPELYLQKPYKSYPTWYKDGKLKPRINCLKKAISLTKKTYEL